MPDPITTTVAASVSRVAASAPWTAHAVGSTMTAASSVMSSGTGVQLARVGDHLRRPAAAGVAAEARLQAGLEVAERDPLAVAEVAALAGGAHRRDAAGDAAEHRLEHDPVAAVGLAEVGHDLVAGHERERHDGLEVAGRGAVDRGQVAAADAGQPRLDAHPVRAGELGRVDVAELQRTDARAGARRGAATPASPPRSGAGCARTGGPSSRASPRAAAAARWPGADRHEHPGRAGRLRPVLDQPAPLAGQGGEAGLGVHGDREADRFEHRQVAGRVGVGHRLARGRGRGAAAKSISACARVSPVGGTSVSSPS